MEQFRKTLRRMESRMLREYFCGTPAATIVRRYGVRRERLEKLATEYKQGKIDIFDAGTKKAVDKMIGKEKESIGQIEQELRKRDKKIAELEETLKMSTIKCEGYEIMLRILKEEYNIDLLKKAGPGQ